MTSWGNRDPKKARRRSSGGACRPAKEGPFPFDDCQDWVQGPG